MAYSKIILNGETLMDVTSDTVDAGNLLSGETATKNSGAKVTGSYVPPSFSTQTKSVSFTPTENQQTSSVTPETGYDGLSKVDISVAGISSTYVGTGVARKGSADLTAIGSTVTVPVGYYSTQATKNVASVTHPNPTIGIVSSTGVVTASHSQTSGYVASGTTTSTLNLTTQAGATITPTETAQTAVSSYRWTTGAVNVAAISSTYVGTGIAKKSSADLTASGSTVTVPVGYYSTQATKNIASGRAYIQPNLLHTLYPTIEVDSATRTITANVNGTLNITPAVSSGYISQGSQGAVLYFGEESASIPSAFIIPTGTSVITSNGTYNVKNYESASVNVAGGEYYDIYKLLAFNSDVIPYSTSGLSDFLNSISIANKNMFAGRIISASENQSISFDNVSQILSSAFSPGGLFKGAYPTVTKNYHSYHFSTCSFIGSSAFYNNDYLTSVAFPVFSSRVGDYAFTNCYNLTSANIPNCSRIGVQAFASCWKLTIASFSKCGSICNSAFYHCKILTTADFPNCVTIDYTAFTSCISLTSINFPNCVTIGSSAFTWCMRLSTASFPKCQNIHSNAFRSCYNLLSLYLLGSSVATLSSVTAFMSTPISTYTTSTGGVYGSIFVPSSLYNTYITTSVWSLFSSRFVSV